MTRPFFYSERGATGSVNLACRPSAGAICTMMATANEANLNRYARPIGKSGRLVVVRKGWKARTASEPGAVSSGQRHVAQMHAAMFPKLPQPSLLTSRDPDDVWDAIGDYAVSLSIDAGAVPASDAVRRYVNAVAHQGAAIDRRIRGGRKQVRWVDPMHPPSDTYTGHWVDWDSLRKCARAVEGGTLVYETYPVGKWTQEELRASQIRRDKVRPLEADVLALRKSRDQLQGKLTAAKSTIADIGAQLAACQSQDAIRNAKAAGWEGGLVAGIEALQTLRGQGPA